FSTSEYAKRISGIVAGAPLEVDLPAEKRLIECLVAIAGQRIASSAHDVSDGGLAVTIAESCFAGANGLGANVTAAGDAAAEAALFGERGARCIVSVAPEKIGALRELAAQYGVAANEIGKVTGDGTLRIEYRGRAVIDSAVEPLRDIWAHSLERIL